mgnify:CR=1 FL=1
MDKFDITVFFYYKHEYVLDVHDVYDILFYPQRRRKVNYFGDRNIV